MNPIPYGRQHITDDDIQAVVETLKSDYLTQGPRIAEFEKAFADYIGSRYAVAVSNGTSALHLSTMSLDVKPGDKVITSPITFSATANCIRYCGGEVVFSDIDPDTYLLDLEKVRCLLENAPKHTYKGLIPVDFAGRAVEMEKFRALADKYNLWIIEDACHAPGGYFIDSKGRKQNCGNGKFSDLTIYSFHPVKHIASGEGGMITTNNHELYKRLTKLRSHGISRNEENYQNTPCLAVGNDAISKEYPGWYMELQDLGYNYRLTDIQAALGKSQLQRADQGLIRRREIAAKYNDAFEGATFIKGQSGNIEGHAYHLYVIEVDDRLGLYNHLRSHRVIVQIHYIPVHLMPYYQRFGWKKGDFMNSENYYAHCLSLPIFPTLTNKEQNFVIDLIYSFYKQ